MITTLKSLEFRLTSVSSKLKMLKMKYRGMAALWKPASAAFHPPVCQRSTSLKDLTAKLLDGET